MATIITREIGATSKGSPLTNQEVDQNFINLNEELITAVQQTDVGTAPNQIPLNQYLGNLAYQDSQNIGGDVGIGGNLVVNGTATVNGTIIPASKTLVTTTTAETLLNKTLISSTITDSTISGTPTSYLAGITSPVQTQLGDISTALAAIIGA